VTVCLLLALSACATTRPSSPPHTRVAAGAELASSTPAAHIVVIVMENKEYGRIIGSSQAPFLNRLARRKVLLTREYAVTHPSLPNYLALTGGATFGIHVDCTACKVSAANLVDQLEVHGMSWKAYMQSMPYPCFKGASADRFPNDYAKKHDPFMYYNDVRRDSSQCRKIVPFSAFRRDLANGLPRFAWISPNECKDMHSCSVSVGDRWLKRWVPRITAAIGTNGIVMILFDEGTTDRGCCSLGSAGGHVAAIIAGPGARWSTRIRTAADHYSILRLIEDEWGFRRLRHAGDVTTPTIRGWKA
jgi:phosphatidylinositol-3-phosphatase